MKRKEKILQFLLMLALVVFVASCGKDDDDDDDNDDNDNPPALESKIYGIAKSGISYENLEGATISVATGEKDLSEDIQVGSDGSFEFPQVGQGTYIVTITFPSYHTMFADSVVLSDDPVYLAFLPVPDSITTPVGALSGIVFDESGLPVEGCSIGLSAEDETITNGYFTSTTSNSNGEFFIGAIPTLSSGGIEIPAFKLRILKDGYLAKVVHNIKVHENQLTTLNTTITEGTGDYNTLFSENFENGMGTWTSSGMWHVQANSAIYNQAYPTYVKLAPDDESDGAIPNAYEGTKAAWYGETETGNFMGVQEEYDDTLSGGTGVTENSGKIISPAIDLSDVASASVNFWSWFEIESVNPNEYGYDIMQIEVVIAGMEDTTIIGKLNPYQDPILEDRAAIPFTSGGFNKAPIWTYLEYDLSEYAGSQIHLVFRFMTNDGLYNGFRGWLVDNIMVTDMPVETKNKTYDPKKHIGRDGQ